jgi:DNA/RNA endonuclease G (NUC1)
LHLFEQSKGGSLSHNRFLVPDWGALRFDLHVPSLSGGRVNVTLDAGDGSTPLTSFVNLSSAVGSAPEYFADTQRIGYGTTGFETFTVDVPDRFRGKTATLRFEASGGTVYLDNVFFKSQHLILGNPTEARTTDTATNLFFNNYLLEKPQYSVSFSGDDHIPNWSAWQLNESWFGSARVNRDFFRDPNLERLGVVSAKDSDYNRPQATINPGPIISPNVYYKFEPGHLAAFADRTRSEKDNTATNLTINIVPQQSEHNDPLWSGVEEFARKVVSNQGREVYVYAGVEGEKNPANDKASISISNDSTYGSYDIHVPNNLWKVLLILDRPGLDVQEINSNNATAFAVWTENKLPDLNPPGTRPKYVRWNDGGMTILTVGQLESRLNRDPVNLARGIRYNFFSTLPEDVRTFLKSNPVSIPAGSSPYTAFLLAEPEQVFGDSGVAAIDSAVWQSSSAEDGTIKYFPDEFSSSQISIRQVGMGHASTFDESINEFGSSQISKIAVGMAEIGTSQISSPQIGSSQTSLPHIGSSETGSTQVDFFQEDFTVVLLAQ